MNKWVLLVGILSVVVGIGLWKPHYPLRLGVSSFFSLLNIGNKYFGENNDPELSLEFNTVVKLLNRVELSSNLTEIRQQAKVSEFIFKTLARQDVMVRYITIPRKDQLNTSISAVWFDPSRMYNPKPTPTWEVLLHFHGGGMVLSSAEGEFQTSTEIAHHTGLPVLSVNYRLLPEHTMEEAVTDGVIAFRYLTQYLKYEPNNIVILGCSAGGTMALYTTLHVIMTNTENSKSTLPAGILLMSPGTGYDIFLGRPYLDYPSVDQPKEKTTLFRKKDYIFFADFFYKDPRNAEYVKKLALHIAHLPLTYMLVSEYDVMRDSQLALGDLLKANGVDIRVDLRRKAFHCYIATCIFGIPEVDTLIEDLSDWIKQTLQVPRKVFQQHEEN